MASWGKKLKGERKKEENYTCPRQTYLSGKINESKKRGGNVNGKSARTHQRLCLLQHQGGE